MKTSFKVPSVGLVGMASFACIALAAFIAPPLWEAPGSTAPAETIAAYVQANRDRFLASLFVYAMAMGFFLWFAAGLFARMRAAEPPPRAWSAVFLVGAVGLAVLVLAAFAPGAVNAYRVQSPELAQALYDLSFALLAVSGIPTALCMGAYAALVLAGGALPGWTGWLALVGAFAHVLIAASTLSSSGFLSLEGGVIVAVPATLFAWLFATSAAVVAQDLYGRL